MATVTLSQADQINTDREFNRVFKNLLALSEKHIGPKPITIEQYRRRNKPPTPREPTPVEEPKKKTRGGKKQKLRRDRAELHRIIAVTRDLESRKRLLRKLKKLVAGHGKPTKQTGGNPNIKQQ